MAMIKPIGIGIPAFDATEEQVFSFFVDGGSQAVKNKIIIRKNDTNTVVYENISTTYAFSQTVPANSLQNNNYYNFSFITYDVSDNASEASEGVSFYCYTTPTLTLQNMPSGNIVGNPSFEFEYQYSQTEGELLGSAYIVLYDINSVEIDRSGTIYSQNSPPISLKNKFIGLIGEESYYVQAFCDTVNGTVIESVKSEFRVVYSSPIFYNKLYLNSKCDDGYMEVINNVILIDGASSPENPTFIDDTIIDLTQEGSYVNWLQGYSVDSNFRIKIFMTPNYIGDFCKIWNDNNDEITMRFERGQFDSGTDCFVVTAKDANGTKVVQRSNGISAINNTSKLILQITKDGSTWDLFLYVIEQSTNKIYWNGTSNVVYEKYTDIQYKDEEYSNVQINEINEDISGYFPITNTEVKNGLFDDLSISIDVTSDFNTDYPEWDSNVILECNFNNSINAGNVDLVVSMLEAIKVKRRKKGTFIWNTLKTFKINTVDDLDIILRDSGIPSGYEFEYAIVPILYGNIESEYVVSVATSKYNALFISNSDRIFKLNSGISYSVSQNQRIGTLTPINKKYPVVIRNSNVNYKSGTLSGVLYGEHFEDNRSLNRNNVTEQVNSFMDFMTDGTAKMWYDYNGDIKMFRLVGSPSISYNASNTNGVANVSFEWVEQGKYDNQQELFDNNFVESLI